MDPTIIKAAIDAIRKEMRGRLGSRFAPQDDSADSADSTDSSDSADPADGSVAIIIAEPESEAADEGDATDGEGMDSVKEAIAQRLAKKKS